MKKLLKGGTVVSGNGTEKADVLIGDEKILTVSKSIKDENAEVIDCTGKLIFPGFIDAHTHFDLEVSNTVTADDFESGSKSAIKGGTTTVIDFATQNKGETLSQALENWHKKADGNTSCDYAFHMAISDWNEKTKADLPEMFEKGVSTFKVYMTYPAMILSDKELYEVLSELKKYGGIVGVHCENAGIIDAIVKMKKEEGSLGVSSHYQSRPDIAEAEAISRILKIAEAVDTPVVIVHLSSKRGLEEIKLARKRGQKVFVESCPQYLLLDDSKYESEFDDSCRYVCSPPLRKQEDMKALWKAFKDGDIDTISTDHCSFTLEQKYAGENDFTKIPNGMPGVETRGKLIYTYGVTKGRISIAQMCKCLCENPAKLYGLYPKKGCIKENADADIVIYDPNKQSVIHANDTESACDYAPFEGVKIQGDIDKVFLRGNEVYSDGKIVKEKIGEFIPREKPQSFSVPNGSPV